MEGCRAPELRGTEEQQRPACSHPLCVPRAASLPLKGPAWQTAATEADRRGARSITQKKSVAVRKREGCSSYELDSMLGWLWVYFEQKRHVSSQEAAKKEAISSPQPVIFGVWGETVGSGCPAVEYASL